MTQLSNVAVLGCGMIVRRGHLPGLRASGREHVPVIYGLDTPNSRELAKTLGIPPSGPHRRGSFIDRRP